MIEFKKTEKSVNIHYQADNFIGNEWLWNNLRVNSVESQIISKAFHIKKSDIINPPSHNTDFENYVYKIKLGELNGDYFHISSRILGISNDLYIHKNITLTRSFFIAERNISIFKKISKLLKNNDPIVIGGERPNAIPASIYEELRKDFPTTYHLNKYAESRIHKVLYQYLDGMKDASANFDKYLKQRYKRKIYDITPVPEEFIEYEIKKYKYIKERITYALDNNENHDEKYWQKLMSKFILLIFPKYIKVLQNVMIKDYYSNSGQVTKRYLDIALIDANGHIDIIEIKKPFENKILRDSLYRDNYIPTLELTGAIMQAEKYLFHLQKWGAEGEKCLSHKYNNEIPKNIKLQISNPKAIIIIGRDLSTRNNKSTSFDLDFEIIKRKYENIIDIITYDDLLRRLENIINALQMDLNNTV